MDRLFVEAPDAGSALSLIDDLPGFHAELLPSENGHCEVKVELGEGRQSQINAALDAVERWLNNTGIEAAKIKLGDRTYLLERRADSAGPVSSQRTRTTSAA